MAAFFAAIPQFLFATKIGRYLLLAVVACAVAFGVMKHFEAEGATEQRAKQEAADAAWMQGAVKNMDAVQAYWAPWAAALVKSGKDRDAQQLEIARLSAANDGRACLDASAVRRLRQLRPKQPGSDANPRPAGSATAGGPRR